MSLMFRELTHDQWYGLEKPLWDAEPECPIFQGSLWRIYPFWGATLFGAYQDGELVSLNATRFSKAKRKNAWGPYINFYVAYTVPAYRRRGYAVALHRYVEQLAVSQGLERVKSLTQSYLGLRLHMSLGHHFWGVNKKNEIIVDAPLVDKDWPTDTVPIEARAAKDAHLLTDAELPAILANPPFNMFPHETWELPKLNYRHLPVLASGPAE